jgi:4,5-dihydroxyphthalate decarboxylase
MELSSPLIGDLAVLVRQAATLVRQTHAIQAKGNDPEAPPLYMVTVTRATIGAGVEAESEGSARRPKCEGRWAWGAWTVSRRRPHPQGARGSAPPVIPRRFRYHAGTTRREEAMAGKLAIRLALERYDRHVPFFMKAVAAPKGVEIVDLEVGMAPPRRDGVDRHGRMLHGHEFDACEMSLCSYILARSRGAAITATPVFPRRLFSQNHMWVNADAGIRAPKDLIGKRVCIWAWQVTMSVLAKGDLKTYYGVPFDRIDWYAFRAEELPWDPPPGIRIRRTPAGRDVGEMLIAGEIDALVSPHPPHSVMNGHPKIKRLFPDARAECLAHYRRAGWFPIMHLVSFDNDLVARHPELPRTILDLWEAAKRQADDFYTDPGYALLAFARNEYEWQREAMGPDIWPSGLKANRANLEQFVGYCRDQGLIDKPIPVDSLFHPSVLDT